MCAVHASHTAAGAGCSRRGIRPTCCSLLLPMLQEEGQELIYSYDIGDNWMHVIKARRGRACWECRPCCTTFARSCLAGGSRGQVQRCCPPAQLPPVLQCLSWEPSRELTNELTNQLPCPLLPGRQVVEFCPEEQSTGAAAVLDGGMACPPEDSNGMEGSGSGGYPVCV